VGARSTGGVKPEFLSGFQTERYAIGLEEGFAQARVIMDVEIRELCRRDIGGDQQVVHTVQTQYVGITFKHILLPVWLATYRYRDVPFRVVVNARTGRVFGQRPYSWLKITLFILAILAALALLFLLVSRAAGDMSQARGFGRPESVPSTEYSVPNSEYR
jgi:hypothetical protein